MRLAGWCCRVRQCCDVHHPVLQYRRLLCSFCSARHSHHPRPVASQVDDEELSRQIVRDLRMVDVELENISLVLVLVCDTTVLFVMLPFFTSFLCSFNTRQHASLHFSRLHSSVDLSP